MRTHLSGTARSLTLAILLLGASAAMADPLTLHVAANGNDAWTGRLAQPNAAGTDGPFATLHRARDLLRETRRAAPLDAPVTIEVAEGTYYLDEPLLLTSEDSGTRDCPITWRAREGERVVLSGGRPIEGPWQTDDGKVHHTDLPEVSAGEWRFRQLRVGDESQPRCRYPDVDPADPYGSGWLYAASPVYDGRLGIDLGVGLGSVQEKGTWLEWDIEVPVAGEYTLRILYADSGPTNQKFFGFTDMSGRTTFAVDGSDAVPIADLTDTGSFYEGFRWSVSANLRLEAGPHTVRWTNEQGGGLSLLCFLLADDPAYEPPLPGDGPVAQAEGKHVIAWDAERYDRKHGDLVQTMNFLDRKDPRFRTTLRFLPGDLEAWDDLAEGELFIIPEWDWVSELVRLTDVDEARGVARIDGINAMKPIFAQNRYCVLNVRAALDSPGEWYLSTREGRLYYQPREESFQKQEIVAPRLDRVIELRGDPDHGASVSYVNLEGFLITDTAYTSPERVQDVYHVNDGAIWLIAADHCRIARNTFREVGGYGVWVHDASHDNVIVENQIVGAGQGGVYLDGYVRDSFREAMPEGRRPYHNLVAGNLIHDCGRFYVHVSGVYAARSADNLIAHNTIHHMPRYGLSLKDNCPGNILEYNEVRFTNLLTRDSAAIEMAGNYAGSIVRYNLVADTLGSGFVGSAGRHCSPCDAGGIYLDNMSSKNQVIGNIVTRSWTGVWVNWGGENVIENNLFVGNRESQALINLPPDPAKSRGPNTLRRNLLVCTDPGAAAYRIGAWKADTPDIVADQNLVWSPGDGPRLLGLPGEDTWQRWLDSGQDAHSLVADPLLENPGNDAFTLGPDSPARDLGFEPIDTSRIGTRGYHPSLADPFG